MIPPKRAKLSAASSQPESTSNKVNQSAQVLSPIEKLPREIFFDIFEYAPERVQNLRTTSSELRKRVNEFARHRTDMQLVDELRLESRVRKLHKLYAVLAVPKAKAYLFELRLQFRKRSIAKSRVKRNRQEQVTFYEMTLRENDDKLWECISEASGRRIGRVSIEICFEKNRFDEVSRLLQSFKFKNLEVSSHFKGCGCPPDIANDVGDDILNFIAAKEIDHLRLSLNLSTIKDQQEYLFKISTLVRSLHFDPRWTFLGKDYQILDYIIGILSRKVDKLLIEDQARGFTNLFSQEMIDFLSEHIPQLGKNIWFQASCAQGLRAKSNSSNHDYRIKVVKRPPIEKNEWSIYKDSPAYYVDIKHVSRAGEPPMKTSMIAHKHRY